MKQFGLGLRLAVLALLVASALSGCGNQTDMDPGARILGLVAQAASAKLRGSATAELPQTDLEVRAALQASGKPILRVFDDRDGSMDYLAPVAVNQGVTTWSSNSRLTLSSRDGVLLATRGFGSDLMAARVPSAAQIARGTGTHDRLHVYLDGGDQVRKFTFTCTLATVGSENITVMGLVHATRHITETCTGKNGTDVNHYWFHGTKLRQSTQFLTPGSPGLRVQAIID